MIFLHSFKSWRAARRRAALQKILAKGGQIQGQKLDRLINLVNSEDFLIFLEYLALTVEEKLTILSNIDLLDDKKRIEAVKLQQQTKGLNQIFDIADYLQMNHHREEDKQDE